jgi:hypothetical protein
MKQPQATTDPSDRSGTPVPGSGTTKIPIYKCDACRDSGQHLVRKIDIDSVDADLAGRVYKFETCPACHGSSYKEDA